MWAGGRIGFCYRQGCGRFGVGVCFGSGHHLDGLVQSNPCMAVACLLVSRGMWKGIQGCLGLAAQTELVTVRTDLHNQSRVKGLVQLRAGSCAVVFCFACISRLFHTNFLRDDRYLTMAGGPDGGFDHRGLQSRILSLTEHG